MTRIADDIRRIAVVSSAAANKDRIGATTEERRTGLGMEICGVEARRNEPFRDPGRRLLVAGDPPASVIGAERGAAEDAAFRIRPSALLLKVSKYSVTQKNS